MAMGVHEYDTAATRSGSQEIRDAPAMGGEEVAGKRLLGRPAAIVEKISWGQELERVLRRRAPSNESSGEIAA
jgi:hypothetical protein